MTLAKPAERKTQYFFVHLFLNFQVKSLTSVKPTRNLNSAQLTTVGIKSLHARLFRTLVLDPGKFKYKEKFEYE